MKKISWQSGLLMLLLLLSGRAQAQPGVTAHSGILGDGATFLLEVPANWNGTLLLYSHGYVVPGDPNLMRVHGPAKVAKQMLSKRVCDEPVI